MKNIFNVFGFFIFVVSALLVTNTIDVYAKTSGFDITHFFIIDVDENIWKSIDNGTTWSKINNSYGSSLNSAAIAANKTNDLFIINNAEDVFSSTNGGLTWSRIATNINGASDDVVSIAIDSYNSFYAVDLNKDILRSTNSGVTWAVVNSSFNGGGSNAAVMIVNSSDTIFIVDNDENIWKSIDNGTTWSKINNSYGSSLNSAAMAVNSTNGLFIINNAEDVFSSTNGGLTWSRIATNINGASDDVVSIVADVNDVLYGVDLGDDIWKSTDSGVTWNSVNSDFNAAGGNPIAMVAVKIDTQAPNLNLNLPNNYFNSSSNSLLFSFNATDNFASNLNCSVYLNSNLNQTNSTVKSGLITFFDISNINDGTHMWNVSCKDINSNTNTSDSRNFTVDTIIPTIEYGAGTEADGANFDRTNIFVNVSIIETNPRNITFYLYNSTSIVNITFFELSVFGNTNVNFTNLKKSVYYYNVSVSDIANNINTSLTRSITLETKTDSDSGVSGGGSGGGGGDSFSIVQNNTSNNTAPKNIEQNTSLTNKTNFDYNDYLKNAEQDIEEMNKSGIPIKTALKLLEEARLAYRQGNFEKLISITSQIKEIKNKGFLALELVSKLKDTKPGLLTGFVVKDFLNEDFDNTIKRARELENLNGLPLFLKTINSTGLSVLFLGQLMLFITFILLILRNFKIKSLANKNRFNYKNNERLLKEKRKILKELNDTKKHYTALMKQKTLELNSIEYKLKNTKAKGKK